MIHHILGSTLLDNYLLPSHTLKFALDHILMYDIAGDFANKHFNYAEMRKSDRFVDVRSELILADIFQKGDTFPANSCYFNPVDERCLIK
jgi:hypothetical protein